MGLYEEFEKEARKAVDKTGENEPVNLYEWSIHAVTCKLLINDLAERIEVLEGGRLPECKECRNCGEICKDCLLKLVQC